MQLSQEKICNLFPLRAKKKFCKEHFSLCMYRLCSYTYCTVYCYRKQCFWTISVQMWIILLNLEITYIDIWTLWFACKQIKPTLSMKTYKYAACPKKFVPICSHTVCFVSFCRILLFHTVSTVFIWVPWSKVPIACLYL